MKMILVVFSSFVILVTWAHNLDELKKDLVEKTNELKRLQHENPSVEFVERDNPSININRQVTQKTKQRKLTYVNGLTTINHRFYCPFHKGSSSLESCCSKGLSAWTKWKSLYDKIKATQKYNQLILAKYEEIEEIKKEIEEQRHRNLVEGSQPRLLDGEAGEKQILRIRRSTIKKLREVGEVDNGRIRLVLVDD